MKKVLAFLFIITEVGVANAADLMKEDLSIALPDWYKIHIIAGTIVLTLFVSVTILYIRLNLQKYKQLQKDRIAALETEELNQKYRLVLRANHTTVWKWDLRKKDIECECENCLKAGNSLCHHYVITEDTFYSRIHPDDQEKIRKTYKNLIDGNITMFREEFRYKFMCLSPDYNWVESFAIVGESNDVNHVQTLVGGMIVTTERKRIEQEALKKRQAEEDNRMKSVFLSSIRHEIRTPLNAIVGFSNLIIQGCEPEEATEYSKIVQQNNALLVQIIDDVLDMSDIEIGEMELSYTQVDVSEMLQLLEKNFRIKVKENVTLSCKIPFKSFFAYLDGQRVSQVLKSFLSNACKFTTNGSINMGFKLITGGLYFYVTDTGKGIVSENIPHVFDRFAKFDPFVQGAGLELALSRILIQKMRGEIGVESEEGKGSTFWFTIPSNIHTLDGGEVLYDDMIVESNLHVAFHNV